MLRRTFLIQSVWWFVCLLASPTLGWDIFFNGFVENIFCAYVLLPLFLLFADLIF